MSKKNDPRVGAKERRQQVLTPDNFIEWIELKFGKIVLDVAACDIDENTGLSGHVCKRYFTEEEDGLKQKWEVGNGNVFCNPPYGDIEPWIDKGIKEIKEGNCYKVTYLLPVRTTNDWWEKAAKYARRYYVSRPKFKGYSTSYADDVVIFHMNYDTIYNGTNGEVFRININKSLEEMKAERVLLKNGKHI